MRPTARLLGLLTLLALPACGPTFHTAHLSEPTTHRGFVWWAEYRVHTRENRDRTRVVMCNPEGVPPCVLHVVPRVNARQLRQWIETGRVGGDD